MFLCNKCGHSSTTKLGKCPGCGEFGSFVEDKSKSNNIKKSKKINQISGSEIQVDGKQNISFRNIENKEFKRLYQRGIKKGGIYLLGGEPGIGKSTIVLQIIQDLLINNENINIGYFSGEENADQVNDRMNRLKVDTTNNFEVYNSTIFEDIITTAEIKKYNFIIVDSIQSIYSQVLDSSSGTINQVKQCSEKISEFCRKNGISVIIIGHVTKGGEIAGPKYLEHIVDVVSYLEGDRFGEYRFLRSKKNRFGNTDDIGIFEMSLFGLKPVYDLKDRIINNANTTIPGNVLTIGIDNGRPVIVNLEVLLNKTYGKFPQRNAIGIDNNRLSMIIAILERYLKINLGLFDIYVNIPGEFKFFDSGLDLSIAAAIYSQYKNIIIDKKLIFLGELGLGGQILKSKFHDKRVKEIPKGFDIIDYNRLKNIVEIGNLM